VERGFTGVYENSERYEGAVRETAPNYQKEYTMLIASKKLKNFT